MLAHILIIDDEPDACGLVKRIAEGLHHEAVAFTDEEEAIEHGRHNRVDLVIVDLKLKKMCGIEVLNRLRAIHPSVRALILTGYPTMESHRIALQIGVSDYLMKPVDVDVLEEKITEALTTPITAEYPR